MYLGIEGDDNTLIQISLIKEGNWMHNSTFNNLLKACIGTGISQILFLSSHAVSHLDTVYSSEDWNSDEAAGKNVKDITVVPCLGLLLCIWRRKRKEELFLLRAVAPICLDHVSTAWEQERKGSSWGELRWQCQIPREQGCEHPESRVRRKKNQVSRKNGLGRWGSRTAGVRELP